MRKVIVSCVAVLALAAPMSACSSSKKSSTPTKADLIKGFEANQIPKDKATCLADKVFSAFPTGDLQKLKDSNATLSTAEQTAITSAEAACGIAASSSTSGASGAS